MKLIPYIPHHFHGRGYPEYDSEGYLIGYNPGCSKCNQFGYVFDLDPDRSFNNATMKCPNCNGLGWATWTIFNIKVN